MEDEQSWQTQAFQVDAKVVNDPEGKHWVEIEQSGVQKLVPGEPQEIPKLEESKDDDKVATFSPELICGLSHLLFIVCADL